MKKLILISIILFLCFLKAQGGFEFAQTVTVDDGEGNAYDLIFGFSPGYTDGYDDGNPILGQFRGWKKVDHTKGKEK